jgi:hypothetical protein
MASLDVFRRESAPQDDGPKFVQNLSKSRYGMGRSFANFGGLFRMNFRPQMTEYKDQYTAKFA